MVRSPSDTRTRSVLRWLFRDRQTGRIVVAQRPNLPLTTWLLATVISWFIHGTAFTVISALGTIALVVWAGDEIARGVNPWRRALGTVVLVAVLITWFGSV
ncbi:MAG: hypothetical protein QOE97_2727 [Pseudonocardiales bacterium]|nr:hypothetical protein [Pseudonocardiales bacterium]